MLSPKYASKVSEQNSHVVIRKKTPKSESQWKSSLDYGSRIKRALHYTDERLATLCKMELTKEMLRYSYEVWEKHELGDILQDTDTCDYRVARVEPYALVQVYALNGAEYNPDWSNAFGDPEASYYEGYDDTGDPRCVRNHFCYFDQDDARYNTHQFRPLLYFTSLNHALEHARILNDQTIFIWDKETYDAYTNTSDGSQYNVVQMGNNGSTNFDIVEAFSSALDAFEACYKYQETEIQRILQYMLFAFFGQGFHCYFGTAICDNYLATILDVDDGEFHFQRVRKIAHAFYIHYLLVKDSIPWIKRIEWFENAIAKPFIAEVILQLSVVYLLFRKPIQGENPNEQFSIMLNADEQILDNVLLPRTLVDTFIARNSTEIEEAFHKLEDDIDEEDADDVDISEDLVEGIEDGNFIEADEDTRRSLLCFKRIAKLISEDEDIIQYIYNDYITEKSIVDVIMRVTIHNENQIYFERHLDFMRAGPTLHDSDSFDPEPEHTEMTVEEITNPMDYQLIKTPQRAA
jgi:hypothetical protein